MAKLSKGAKAFVNLKKQRQKYPAIMEKIIENSDIVIEVLDARFIEETRNPAVEEAITSLGKKVIFALNKSDLIDKNKLKLGEIHPYVLVSCSQRKGIRALRDLIKRESKKVEKPSEKFGRVAVGVIGYPNVGKSSLINLLIGKSAAGVGSDAGFTKSMQKLRLTSEIVILDTPGVIPKSEYSSSNKEAIAQHTKLGARSYSQIKEPEIVIDKLIKEFPDVLEKFYKIKAEGDSEVLIEELGKEKGFMKKGGIVDEDKTARLILKDWQMGKIRV